MEPLNLNDYILEKKYWAVGSSYGGIDDHTEEFLANSQWVEGWGVMGDTQNQRKLEEVEIGDILVMKSSATRGVNHAITFTRIKAIGIVLNKVNYFTFSVKWFNTIKFPLDFDGIRYSRTIEQLREDNLKSYVKQFIDEQDIRESN